MQREMACLSFPALTMGSLLLFLEALLKPLVYYKQVFPVPQPLQSLCPYPDSIKVWISASYKNIAAGREDFSRERWFILTHPN